MSDLEPNKPYKPKGHRRTAGTSQYPVHANSVIELTSARRRYNKKCRLTLNHRVVMWIVEEPDPVYHIGIQPKYWRYKVVYFLYPIKREYRRYHISYKTELVKNTITQNMKTNGFKHLGEVDANESNKSRWREFYIMSGFYENY